MAEWGFDVDADAPCASLTVEQRQVVEITRALAAGTRCLLLDEPTAALERGAVQRLFDHIRQLRAAGRRDLVHLPSPRGGLRDLHRRRRAAGRRAGAGRAAGRGDQGRHGHRHGGGQVKKDHDPERAWAAPAPRCSRRPGARGTGRTAPPDLVVSGVSLASPGVSLSGVSMTVRGGERVGITGLRGSGATTLARIVAGAAAPDAGEVRLSYPGGATACCGRATGPGRCAPGSATFPRTGRPKGSCRCSARRRTSR